MSFGSVAREGGLGAHDQTMMTVMLLSRQIRVSSRMGSWCSD
jgi:hypothetical protein